MPRSPSSPLVIALAALLGSLVRLSAQTTTSPTPVPPPPAPVAAAVQHPWDITTTLRASAGWRNNVTVSAFHPVDRAFWRAESEMFLLRPFGDRWQLISFVNGDVLRYFAPPPGVSGEQQWVGHLEGRWQPGTWLRAALKADAFTETTFIDPSQTEGAQLAPLRVKVRGGYATFAPRVTLPWGFVLEPSLQAKRITYRGYNGDYDELRPGARLEWKRSDLLVLSATWFDHLRHYSALTESKAGGRPAPGWLLTLHQREGEFKAASSFAAHGTWNVAATFGRLENRDLAFGYLDYNQKRAVLDLNWSRGSWRISATGEARRIEYVTQKVGAGLEQQRPARIADNYEIVARIERDLTPHWTAFVENRWERNRSNAADENGAYPFSYRTNTALLGLQRTF